MREGVGTARPPVSDTEEGGVLASLRASWAGGRQVGAQAHGDPARRIPYGCPRASPHAAGILQAARVHHPVAKWHRDLCIWCTWNYTLRPLCVWLYSLSIKFSPRLARVNTSLLFMAASYSTVWTYRLLFIHSSGDGHRPCSHYLAIIDNSAMSTVCTFWGGQTFPALSGIYLAVKLLARLCLTSWETAGAFSKADAPFCI